MYDIYKINLEDINMQYFPSIDTWLNCYLSTNKNNEFDESKIKDKKVKS